MRVIAFAGVDLVALLLSDDLDFPEFSIPVLGLRVRFHPARHSACPCLSPQACGLRRLRHLLERFFSVFISLKGMNHVTVVAVGAIAGRMVNLLGCNGGIGD